MATPVLIPLAEYLATTYRPDCDYMDGEVIERNRGEKPHSGLQLLLIKYFLRHEDAWGIAVWPEQRVQVSPTRFRVPDLCVTSLEAERVDNDRIIQIAPLLCMEVLSSEQTLRDMQDRTDDYFAMGVPATWAFDPVRQLAWAATLEARQLAPAAGRLTVPGQPIALELEPLFTEYTARHSGR